MKYAANVMWILNWTYFFALLWIAQCGRCLNDNFSFKPRSCGKLMFENIDFTLLSLVKPASGNFMVNWHLNFEIDLKNLMFPVDMNHYKTGLIGKAFDCNRSRAKPSKIFSLQMENLNFTQLIPELIVIKILVFARTL